jgi:beta-glucosidase
VRGNESFRSICPDINHQEFSVRWSGIFTPKKDGSHVFYLMAQDGRIRLLLEGEVVADSTGLGVHFEASVIRKLISGKPCTIELFYSKEMGRDWNEVHLGVLHEEESRVGYSDAMEAAKSADAVIVSAGFTARSEGEGHDRDFSIGALQEQLIIDAARANPNTLVAVYAGGNVDMRRWIDRVKGLLYLWYPGQEGAMAAAEILFGVVNPAGKLPVSFEKQPEDRSSFTCYLDRDQDKRVFYEDGIFFGYRHHDIEGHPPLFPFGFGLSYTTFAYSNIRLSKRALKRDESLIVSMDVVNTGKCRGAEVVQIYVRDENASLRRPAKELKGFGKVTLAPGETQTVTIKLPARAFQFWHPDHRNWVAEPGDFEICVAASAADIRLREKVEII